MRRPSARPVRNLLSCVAIDSSKFKAVNNRDQNFTPRKIALRISHPEQGATRYLEEMTRFDRQEARATRVDKVSHLEAKPKRVQAEVHRLSDLAEQLKDTVDGRISLTDPDARSVAKALDWLDITFRQRSIPRRI